MGESEHNIGESEHNIGESEHNIGESEHDTQSKSTTETESIEKRITEVFELIKQRRWESAKRKTKQLKKEVLKENLSIPTSLKTIQTDICERGLIRIPKFLPTTSQEDIQTIEKFLEEEKEKKTFFERAFLSVEEAAPFLCVIAANTSDYLGVYLRNAGIAVESVKHFNPLYFYTMATIAGMMVGNYLRDHINSFKLPAIKNEYTQNNKYKQKAILTAIGYGILRKSLTPIIGPPSPYSIGCEMSIAGTTAYYLMRTVDDIRNASKTKQQIKLEKLLVVRHANEAVQWIAQHTKLVTAVSALLPTLYNPAQGIGIQNLISGTAGYCASKTLEDYLGKEEKLPEKGNGFFKDLANKLCNNNQIISLLYGTGIYELMRHYYTLSAKRPNSEFVQSTAIELGVVSYFAMSTMLRMAKTNQIFNKTVETLETKLCTEGWKKPITSKIWDGILKYPEFCAGIVGAGTITLLYSVLPSLQESQNPTMLVKAVTAVYATIPAAIIYAGMTCLKGLLHSTAIQEMKLATTSSINAIIGRYDLAISEWQKIMAMPTTKEKEIENKMRLADLYARKTRNIESALDLYLECLTKKELDQSDRSQIKTSPFEWAKKALFFEAVGSTITKMGYVLVPTINSKINFSFQCLKEGKKDKFVEVWRDIIHSNQTIPEILCLAGYCLESIHYNEEANEVFKQCVDAMTADETFLDKTRSIGDHTVYVMDPSKQKFKKLENTFIIKEKKGAEPAKEYLFLQYLQERKKLLGKAVEPITTFRSGFKGYYVMRHATRPGLIAYLETVDEKETETQFLLVMDSLAALHNCVQLNTQSEQKLINKDSEEPIKLFSKDYEKILLERAFKGKKTDTNKRLGETPELKTFLGRFHEQVLDRMRLVNKKTSPTIVHGDYYATNVLKDGIIIDFDRIGIGNPLDDLSHFFARPKYQGLLRTLEQNVLHGQSVEEKYVSMLESTRGQRSDYVSTYTHRKLFNSLCLCGAMLNQGNTSEAKEYFTQSAGLMRKINPGMFDAFSKYVSGCDYPEYLALM